MVLGALAQLEWLTWTVHSWAGLIVLVWKFFIATVLFVAPELIWAGCYNNEDLSSPPRRFQVCLDGNCIEDILLWECGNTTWAGAGFSSGYQVSCEVAVQNSGYDTVTTAVSCIRKISDFVLSDTILDQFTCQPMDGDGPGCEWYEN